MIINLCKCGHRRTSHIRAYIEGACVECDCEEYCFQGDTAMVIKENRVPPAEEAWQEPTQEDLNRYGGPMPKVTPAIPLKDIWTPFPPRDEDIPAAGYGMDEF